MAENDVIKIAKALFKARHPGDDWDHNYKWFQEAMKSEEFKNSQEISASHMMTVVFRDAVVVVEALK